VKGPAPALATAIGVAVLAVVAVAATDDPAEVDSAATTAVDDRAPTTEDRTTTSRAPTTAPPSTSTSTTSAVTTAATAPRAVAAPRPTTTPPPTTPAPPYRSSVAGVTAQQLHASWREGCPVAPSQLRMVTLTHWGFDGAVHQGRLVVHADHAATVVAIFGDLYAQRFAIQRMEPVEAFGGSDDASMAANNTSAFNCRAVTGGSSWSQHSYGWAIDVNPVQNPYVKGSTVLPEAGRAHLDRSTQARGKIRAGDGVVQAFAARGWGWGGYWSSPKDYQHFSATNR
jgi:hypothetical protein